MERFVMKIGPAWSNNNLAYDNDMEENDMKTNVNTIDKPDVELDSDLMELWHLLDENARKKSASKCVMTPLNFNRKPNVSGMMDSVLNAAQQLTMGTEITVEALLRGCLKAIESDGRYNRRKASIAYNVEKWSVR